MRIMLWPLMLLAMYSHAETAPLRFSIADSWAMPIIELEGDQPTRGILFDMMSSLARQVGRPAEFHVLARARVQTSLQRAEVDIRCFVAPSWLPDNADNLLWSQPLMTQRDVLVTTDEHTRPILLQNLPSQHIGTVLSYSYPVLQPLFDSGQLHRDDARNQEQVLQKLLAGRFEYAVSNQWTLDWLNQHLEPQHRLHVAAVIQEQSIGCLIRNDPSLPTQKILDTLLQMKTTGEIEQIIRRYTQPPPTH